jgi:hypothetical protein
MYEGIVVPASQEASVVLARYCGGFARCEDENHKIFWIRLLKVDREKGIIVDAVMLEGSNTWQHFSPKEEKIFNPEGIMMFDRGGPFEMFGDITVLNNGELIQRYSPFGRDGKPKDEADIYVNYFHLPGSKYIPYEVRESYHNS